MRMELLTSDIPQIFPLLETLLQDGGKKLYSMDAQVKRINFQNGLSGYHYQEQELEATFEFGILFGGAGFVVRRSLKNSGESWERFDYFNSQGNFTFSSHKKDLEPLLLEPIEMDTTCPFLNHLYNFLGHEYTLAAQGKSWSTQKVYIVEKFLRQLFISKIIHLPIRDGMKDPAIVGVYNKILQTESDPVLTWEERQIVYSALRIKLAKIIKTKVRAHRLSNWKFGIENLGLKLMNFRQRFMSRPMNNLRGLLNRYTVGKVLWFFNTVKNNLGYSIALAVYGPFTYYFITMPMNPHAMQAVGKVRSTYLEFKSEVNSYLDQSELKSLTSAPVVSTKIVSDEVKTAQSSVSDVNSNAKILANVIYPSQVASPKGQDVAVNMGQGVLEKYHPSRLNMLLTTDVEKVDKQGWNERMSLFKQMQIAYEENIEFASRLGRLEQLETQYNFPMQIESTWEELERYNNLIFKIRQENPNLSAKMKQYLTNEVDRTQQLELYLWDRMGRFILDQIYVMLDQDKEQKRNDYYVGRSFVFMQEMTNILSWRYKNFKKPEGYERIEKLANFYSSSRKEFGSVMKNLRENSDLYKQKDVLNTKEFRAYMKRQWEILYLQNSKAEEASNNGLNMYIWSVRNTAWVLQTLFAAKKEELGMLVKRDLSGALFSPAEQLSRSKISMQYETLLHNLTLEYVGIREEIMNRLGKDIESTQRMVVIENLKEFLSDRDKLDGVQMAVQKTAENKL